jgi:hypothetical protein
MSEQYVAPVRVVAVNPAEHRLEDASEDIALEILRRADLAGQGATIIDTGVRRQPPRSGSSTDPATEIIVSWDQRFFDPIMVPGRKPLVTLRDAPLFITKLPKAEHDAEEWQAAMRAFLLVTEQDGRTMFAGIGVMRVLHRHKPKTRPAPRQKAPKVYRSNR